MRRNDRFKEIVNLELRGHALYLKGIQRNVRSGTRLSDDKPSPGFLDRGDVLVTKAQKMAVQETPHLKALYAKYGI